MLNNGRDELDRILDGALANYSSRQPLAGIEQRVINRLSTERRFAGQWLRWAAPVLAGALAIAVYLPRPLPEPAAEPQRVARRQPQSMMIPPATALVPEPAHTKTRAIRKNSAKRNVFPAAAPLTGEERALVRLAMADPVVLQSAMDLREQLNQPVAIEPINIPPLAQSDALED